MCVSLCIRLSNGLPLLQARFCIGIWMSATSQVEPAQIAANKWPACSQNGLDTVTQKLRASSWPPGWLTGIETETNFRTLPHSVVEILPEPERLNEMLAMKGSRLFLLQTIMVSLPHYVNVFTRLCTMPLRCWEVFFFFLLFLMMLLLWVNTTFSFKAPSSVKEAYKPNPQGSDVLSRSAHTPPQKLLAPPRMHMMFVNLHEN